MRLSKRQPIHLHKENGALQVRGRRGLQASWGAPKRVLLHLLHLPRQGNPVATAIWDCPVQVMRDKGEQPNMPQEQAANLLDLEYQEQEKNLPSGTVPRFDDPLTRQQLRYLNGSSGSVKTTRVIDHISKKTNPLLFTHTHRLAKEMRATVAKAQTPASFFRWSGQAEWTTEKMGQKYIPIWVEVCIVSQPMLKTFIGSTAKEPRSSVVVIRASHL